LAFSVEEIRPKSADFLIFGQTFSREKENGKDVLQGNRRSPHRLWLCNKPMAYFVKENANAFSA
jgi:hypothetical protein